MSNEPTKTAVPLLRFPEFREAGEWEEMKLGKIGKIITGKTPSTQNAEFWGGSILFITPTDISENNKYQTQTQRTVSNNTIVKILPVGSIVYTCIASIGKIAITTEDSCTNQQINSIFVNKNIDNEFIYYSLINLTPYIKSKTAISTLPIINKSEFSSFEVILPEFAEQQKIAACLSSLDDLLTAQTAKLAALQAHKRGLLQGLFPAAGETVPKLRFPEFREAGEWVETNFYNLIDEVLDFRGRTPQKIEMSWGDGEIVSLSANNVKNGYIDYNAECNMGSEALYEKWMGKVNLEKGDIIFTMEAPLGKALLLPDSQKYILSQRVVAFKVKHSINNQFLIQLIWSEQFQKKLQKLSTGSTAKGINQKTLRTIIIELPSEIEEQQKIAACLSSLDDRISAQTAQLAALQLHKKGLMQGLFPTTPETTA